MTQVLELLESQNKLPADKVSEIRSFIAGNQVQEAPKPKVYYIQ